MIVKRVLRKVTLLQTILNQVRAMDYYRADGVRITHNPYDPAMMEKYGKPGETDNEGEYFKFCLR